MELFSVSFWAELIAAGGHAAIAYATPAHVMEMVASIMSCSGAHLVSTYGHFGRAVIGWGLWIAAGVLWVTFAASQTHWFMALTQSYFFYTACIGWRNTRRLSRERLGGVQVGLSR